MRFHHSTRRGRHHSAPSNFHNSGSTRWSQLNHCRETNIYFNRRLPVEYPAPPSSQLYLIEPEYSNPNKSPSDRIRPTGLAVGQAQQGQQASSRQEEHNGPTSNQMDLDSLREKLIAQVQKHPFWSNKAAKRMQIKQVERRNIYIYELESYCERRDLEWNFEPYRGGLSANSVIPYRSHQLIGKASLSSATGSLSQPVTPLTTAGGSGQFVWCADQAMNDNLSAVQANKSPISRSLSNKTPLGKTSVFYEPISARLEHLIPSPDFVWSIDVMSSQQQQRGRRNLSTPGRISSEVPNSSFVKRCHGCQGKGKLKCNSCHGVGYEVCLSCSGKGSTRSYAANSSGRGSSSFSRAGDRSSSSYYDRGLSDQSFGGSTGTGSGATDGNSRNSRYANGNDDPNGLGSSLGVWFQESCSNCHGAGQKRCWVCAGKSYNNCPGCAGAGNLRCFLNLTVSWLSHFDDVIINNADQIIPKERLRVCSGPLIVDQVEDRLRPLNLIPTTDGVPTSSNQNQPDQLKQEPIQSGGLCRFEAEQLQMASKHLLEKHQITYKGEKFLKQRHKVTQIECHLVRYEWKQRQGQFVIYGEQRKVYIGKYPFKSFCNLM